MPLVLELHDAGILAVDATGTIRVESPGFTLLDGGTLVTGQAALARAREKPRWIHHRFWQDLDTEPLGRPFPRGLSAADLVHAQLADLWSAAKGDAGDTDSVLIAVPGAYDARQLGLILGITRACGLPVEGLVDSAVAATVVAPSVGSPQRKVLHLDLHLHRIVVTELEVSESHAAADTPSTRVIRRHVHSDESFGTLVIQDAWAKHIAELFVHSTRFDPLHSAATEQALYHHLPGWLEALRDEEIITLELGSEGRQRSVELTRPDIVDAADACYDHLRDLLLSLKRAGEEITLLLAPAAAALPGLEPRLAGLRGVTTARLTKGSAAAGALIARSEITTAGAHNTESDEAGPAADRDSRALPFVTRLSFETRTRAAISGDSADWLDEGSAPPSTVPCPSHLVHEGLAYPIAEAPFLLGLAIGDQPGLELSGPTAGVSRAHCRVARIDGQVWVEDLSTYGSFVNDERVAERAILAPGDRLRLGTPGIEVQLITVLAAETGDGGGDR